MITRIQALRYRCFNWLDVSWQRYNVLAGANGSGKSTLLDIPQLFSDILLRGLIAAFLETSPAIGTPRAQSLMELTHCHRGGDFGFVLEAELPEHVVSSLVTDASPSVQESQRRWPHTLRYEIRFGIFNDIELQVIEEFLWLIPQNASKPEKGIRIGDFHPRSWRPVIIRSTGGPADMLFEIKPQQGRRAFSLRLEPSKLALANLPLDSSLYPATVWFLEMLKQDMVTYAPNIQKLHEPCLPGKLKRIDSDAGNLPWMVLGLKQERAAMFEAWLEHVQTAIPNIIAIEAVKYEDSAKAY